MKIYGILHLAPRESSAHNVKISGFDQQIEIYLRNAATLSASLKFHGIPYTLLTNDKTSLDAISRKLGLDLDMIEISCMLAVPSGLSFYSAHFKINALEYISKSIDDYCILCDLDMICISAVPNSLKNIVARQTPLFYDITDQVIPAYGHKVIMDDIGNISGMDAQGRWAGGEFIAGPPDFFGRLHDEAQEIWPRYLSNAKTLHHIGDEAVVSSALERMVAGGEVISDAGTLGIVGRFWSGNINHHQRKLAHYRDNFLLHLPADKMFLANYPRHELPNFMRHYRRYYNKVRVYGLFRRPVRWLRNLARGWFRR